MSIFINEIEVATCQHGNSQIGTKSSTNVDVSKHNLWDNGSRYHATFLMYPGDILTIWSQSVLSQYTDRGFNFYFDIYDFN